MFRRSNLVSRNTRRLPLRLEAMETRLAPAIFNVNNLNDSGSGSLRQAVLDANVTGGADTIIIAPIFGTITLTSGELFVTEGVNIIGPGAAQLIVSGNKASRIFNLANSNINQFHVGISGMTLTNGVATGSNQNGGAITSEGEDVLLTDVAIVGNSAPGNGGGIHLGNDARLTMVRGSMTNNTAAFSGGAVYAELRTVTILSSSTIAGNTATQGDGGAINVERNGQLLVDTCTISGNRAASDGGGIQQNGYGLLTIKDSTISGNFTGNRGGGVYVEDAVDVVNSTITQNSSVRGGGVYLARYFGELIVGEGGGGYAGAAATFRHCTITSNLASGTSASGSGGGIFSNRNADLQNTIVALNSGDVDNDLHSGGYAQAVPGGAVFNSSFSLIQDKGAANVNNQNGTIFGVAPLLGPLQNNGGATLTRALLTGSRGIDEGDPAFAAPPALDQRGQPRVANGRLDIGAFELQPGTPPPPPRTTVNLNAVGSGPRGDATVRVYKNDGTLLITFQPFDTSFKGEIHVATGDMNGDGVEDVITGAGPGGGPHVQVFDGNNLLNGKAERIVSALGSYFAYNPGFRGGVNVAAGDVNGDGKADIITGAGPGGGPHVIAWDVATGQAITSFYAYDAGFRGGVNVGSGDVAGKGSANIITGPGAGGGPHVRVFNNSGGVVKEFFAYDDKFTGGVYVAGGDINGDGIADVVTGAGAGGGPHVKVFDGTSLAMIRSFFAYESIFMGGVRVATGNLDADGRSEIIVGAGPLGGPHVRFVDDDALNTQINSFYSIDKDFNGGVFVG